MLLRYLMHGWEQRLYQRDLEARRVRPFEWGLEFLGNGQVTHRPLEFIQQFNNHVLASSDQFYTPAPAQAADFEFDGFWLRFPSGVETPYPKNNTVYARYFPAGRDDRAVIILPHWNGDEQSYVTLCRWFNLCGISALRLSLPYHDRRMPEGLTRADYMVSPNIGRTIQAVQQAVQDARRAADWLVMRGIKRIGLLGTSIGSCVAWLTFVHDRRFEAGAFNHVSSYFGDVVWRGITTAHIRRSLEAHLTRDEVRQVWLSISPSAYLSRIKGDRRHALMISARYDLTFPPDLAQIVFEAYERYGAAIRKVILPCGHYTTGKTPFKYLDAYHLVNFFRRIWRRPERGNSRV